MKQNDKVTEDQLHAYVDGLLDVEQQKIVEIWLKNNPEDQQRINAWQKMNRQLRVEFPLESSSHVTNLTDTSPKQSYNWLAIAASFIFGISIGLSSIFSVNKSGITDHLLQPAAFAHTIFATEQKYPVEIQAKDRADLIAWLSNRLHTPIHEAQLENKDFEWLGGRLLPSTNRMAAQFMYEHKDGLRLSLYSRHIDWEETIDNSLHFASQDGLSVFYWTDSDMAYAVVSPVTRSTLEPLATDVQKQLIHANSNSSLAWVD